MEYHLYAGPRARPSPIAAAGATRRAHSAKAAAALLARAAAPLPRPPATHDTQESVRVL